MILKKSFGHTCCCNMWNYPVLSYKAIFYIIIFFLSFVSLPKFLHLVETGFPWIFWMLSYGCGLK